MIVANYWKKLFIIMIIYNIYIYIYAYMLFQPKCFISNIHTVKNILGAIQGLVSCPKHADWSRQGLNQQPSD